MGHDMDDGDGASCGMFTKLSVSTGQSRVENFV